MSFGERLKKLREERGIYQRDLATYIGVTPTTISYYESNTKKPKMDKLNKIADFFGVTIDYLLGEETANEIDEFPEGMQLIRRAAKELSPKGKAKLARFIKTFLDEEE
ncbi:MAG: helix-turn-helix domain-containing protein [Vallitalea sp.]|nr:helix-turn-helix domain-containing protein [Vallitalea sp.]